MDQIGKVGILEKHKRVNKLIHIIEDLETENPNIDQDTLYNHTIQKYSETDLGILQQKEYAIALDFVQIKKNYKQNGIEE